MLMGVSYFIVFIAGNIIGASIISLCSIAKTYSRDEENEK